MWSFHYGSEIKITMWIYHFCWTIIYTVFAPIAFLGKNRRLRERLALDLPRLPVGKENIWVHALSVGEVVSALPLVNALARAYPEKEIVFTVTTVKGMAVAKQELTGKVRALMPMPLDAPRSVGRMVHAVNPCVFILIETDIWPGLIGYLDKMGVKTVLVNGRISPRTYRSYRMARLFVKMMYRHVALCLMQSDLDRKRLLDVGVRPSQRVITVGNIKFDRECVPMDLKERNNWCDRLQIGPKDVLWVAGSTHPGEEEILLDVHKRLCERHRGLRLIIAPRKVERSAGILATAKNMGFSACLKTELTAKAGRRWDVLILNTIGELGRIYGLGKVGFVGGSLVPFGGHNLLEPAQFGCPVVFGRHMHNFVHMSNSLLEIKGGFQVHNGDELYNIMNRLFLASDMREKTGASAKQFVETNRGALDRVLSHIGGVI